MLIDSHCHLHALENLDQVIDNGLKFGITKIINPCVDFKSCIKSLEIAQKYHNVFLALGIHPEEGSEDKNINIEAEIKKISTLINENQDKVIAIGECGLDFKFSDNSSQNEIEAIKQHQLQLFKAHINLAQKYDLSLIIHNRHASQEILDLIQKYNNNPLYSAHSKPLAKKGQEGHPASHLCEAGRGVSGVFHCFVGSKKLVPQILALNNFYFGIGGLITLDQGLAQVVKEIPLEKIILETDSPYLMPLPVKLEKSWPNEPANIFHIATKLAEIKQLPLSEIARITTNNCESLFKI